MGQEHRNQRQLILWHAVANAIGCTENADQATKLVRQMAADNELPALLLDPRPSIDQIVRRHPELEAELLDVVPGVEGPVDDRSVRRALLFSKMLVNVFGAHGSGTVSAKQLAGWQSDVKFFQRSMAHGGEGSAEGDQSGLRSLYESQESMEDRPDHDWKSGGTGGGVDIDHDDVKYALDELRSGRGLMSAPEIKAALERTERNLVNRMALREILKDSKLVEKMTPSMALTEQLLRDKDNLKGPALKNAKILIHRFIQDLSDLIKKDVQSTSRGKVDTRVPPKRTFANLDLKKTLWKNLINWDPNEQRMYVDQLYYKRRATRQNDKTRLIIVVDQSGSMIPAMINCTILASIFAGLPKVDAHLIAFDTNVIDLTPWVNDPFEVLLRTKLGGGNDGPTAMRFAAEKIRDPSNTVMVWISDFYDYHELFGMCKAVKESGATFIPVGSVSTTGYFSLNPWFRDQFKKLGTPVISGSLKTLIREMKAALPD